MELGELERVDRRSRRDPLALCVTREFTVQERVVAQHHDPVARHGRIHLEGRHAHFQRLAKAGDRVLGSEGRGHPGGPEGQTGRPRQSRSDPEPQARTSSRRGFAQRLEDVACRRMVAEVAATLLVEDVPRPSTRRRLRPAASHHRARRPDESRLATSSRPPRGSREAAPGAARSRATCRGAAWVARSGSV